MNNNIFNFDFSAEFEHNEGFRKGYNKSVVQIFMDKFSEIIKINFGNCIKFLLMINMLFSTDPILAQPKQSERLEQQSYSTQETAVTKYMVVDGVKYAFRTFGKKEGIPLVFLIHFTATMDDWDPALINPLAEKHPIILIDNKGIGGSEGTTPMSVEEMADDAAKLILNMGYKKVNVLGFSIGGFIAQSIATKYPDLINKLILAGTSPKGGKYISDLLQHLEKATKEDPNNPRMTLFFSRTENGKKAGQAYTERLKLRRADDRVPRITKEAIANQGRLLN